MTMWFELRGDKRLGQCATAHCGGQPTWRLEADGVGSDYCSGCKERLTRSLGERPREPEGERQKLDVIGFSGSINDSRDVIVRFRRNVTIQDRADLLDAINAAAHPRPAEQPLREALKKITVFKVEDDDDTYIRICGVTLMPIKSGRPAERALLKFDALQRAALQPAQSGEGQGPVEEVLTIRTASEIEHERLARKRAQLAGGAELDKPPG
ncbi:hypothetical protein IC762_12235 [Bradyrhizobium genosp. L]|uniref:hypothetical protein n=1 Tax=Bradyrhizobium genosp. L TaxID=83637 RepID=UPI0018A25AF0|nr:hypothetical protein [Bradyrhizobium genosp. L]QPF87013.1 hypothetical protein IC762_12235 [Bradyrhizobium genosp. L]